MDLQQKFGERLLLLLEEKNISQGKFAEKMGCSRQSINFYILGKRSPDITLAAKMAEFFGVSCDYMIGLSDFRTDKESNFTVHEVGMSEDTMKFFAGYTLMAKGLAKETTKKYEVLGLNYENEVLPYNMNQAQISLDLLNNLISHDQFGILLQYIKKYRDVCRGEDNFMILNDFMLSLDVLQKDSSSNQDLIKEFLLHVISKYFDEIVKDIANV